MLSLPTEAHVSPMADVAPESTSFFAVGPSSQHIEPIHSQTMVSFFIEECTTPLVEELSSNLFIDVVPDKILIFIILMNEVHSVSVPLPQGVPLSFSLIVIHHFYKLHDSSLKITHLIRTRFNFL
jgi:hypothetical protein